MFYGAYQWNAYWRGQYQIKRTAATTEPLLGGKGDNGKDERKRYTIKPTGLVERKIPKKLDGIPEVEKRIQETHEVAVEVQKQALKQFTDEQDYDTLSAMAELSAMDMEIGQLLRKKLRTDEEEAMLIILLALS